MMVMVVMTVMGGDIMVTVVMMVMVMMVVKFLWNQNGSEGEGDVVIGSGRGIINM